MKKGFLLICACLAIISCNKRGSFEVSGSIAGANGETIYLEHESLTSVLPVDSVKISPTGNFRFKEAAPSSPSFYRLRWKNSIIHLGVDSVEHIVITADTATFSAGYTVKGSQVCADIKEITLKQQEADRILVQLANMNNSGVLPDTAHTRQAIETIVQLKDFLRYYILRSPQSLTAYYALFQRVNGTLVFGLYDKADFQLYSLVANVLKVFYPDNERTRNLEKLALLGLAEKTGITSEKPVSFHADDIGVIELLLPCISGEAVSLSEYAKGGITLLDFTAYESAFSPSHNMLLGELYEKYRDKGLKIYQVSIDKDEHIWKNKVLNLPWMCVWAADDKQGDILMSYNVGHLPASFIINGDGDINARIGNEQELKTYLEQHLK